jgi:hypothetical protein
MGQSHMGKYRWIAFIIVLVTLSCGMSEFYIDKSAGINGGFERMQKGLPVNWLIYSPKTVPNADFDVYLDTLHFKEGRQSLCFDVRSCSSTGGWHSPGFTNEFEGEFQGPATYRIQMWVRTDTAQYRIRGGGVSPKEGNMKTLHINYRKRRMETSGV